MVKSIEKEWYDNVEVSIIPTMGINTSATLKEGDTLAIIIKTDKDGNLLCDADTAQSIAKMFQKAFPNNSILLIPDIVKLGVIKKQ